MKNYDIFTNQIVFHTGEKYEVIYEYFVKKYKIQYNELFVFFATLGFINDSKGKREGGGREFRSTYLTSQQKSALFTIILSDSELGNDVDGLTDPQNRSNYKNLLEEYSIGGIDYLINKKLGERIKENYIQENYNFYTRDFANMIIDELEDTFF